MRVATIDIGTNSVLLLVADRRGDELVPVLERAEITRLGRGVDRSRELDPEAVRATLACLSRYAGEIASAGATRIAAVGTSAMRDARGGDDFVQQAREILGVAPQVISGAEEAALTFAGALSGLRAEGPVLVFDLGGGSTEIIRGRGEAVGVVEQAVSIDLGCVRATERHLHADPPLREHLDAVRREARALLSALGPRWSDSVAPCVVGVAGTVTTLAACALGVAPYDAARVHGARLRDAEITRLGEELARLPLAERRAVRALDPRRADVIVAGAVIVAEVLEWARAEELVVSDRGVRWGLARQLLRA